MAAPPLPTFRVSDTSENWMPSSVTIATVAALITATVLIISREVLWPRWAAVLPNPLKTSLKRMNKEDIKDLVYKPDQFPGARDVETPYGSIRVYEFGPEDGPKVIHVHGITTSSITLGRIANGLVDRGCRVMLFDLFGRGFSDGVGDLPHDARLYTTQMLLALASSPLSWTGDNSIRVIGYSLGGGIATHFANAFPNMISSLVLLAPAGLVRAERFGRITRFVFSSGIIPERILASITSQRLQKPLAQAATKDPAMSAPPTPAVELAASELGNPNAGALLPLEKRVSEYVRWMVSHHIGFVPAFMSSIRHAPLMGQHEAWKQLAKRKPGTTAVILAKKDEIINLGDYETDGLPLLGGDGNVLWKVLPGTHDFVMTHSAEILEVLDDIWEMKPIR